MEDYDNAYESRRNAMIIWRKIPLAKQKKTRTNRGENQDVVGVQLKPFLPQLQPTLLKGLNDPARQVRVKAGNALGLLSQIHVRIDPIFVELLNGLKMNDDPSFKETYLLALKNCLAAVASKLSEDMKKQTEQSLINCQSNESDVVRQTALSCKEILLSSN
ncbi:unnamed protein product [Rotaria magnacalcarata]|uniref:Uncharacterized protein n=1 Tax=Rotaria magnacalcarata TaxID=392030 RepID=A0A816WUP3_9BILA|nr:unnamed protein product [Rotaria magnacalcarata]